MLGTNAADLDAAQMLERSKQRAGPEKRVALVKGPLAVRPVYVHKEERMLGLVFCTMVALLLFALLELLTRRAGLSLSGQQLLAQCATLAVVVLVLHDGSTLRTLRQSPAWLRLWPRCFRRLIGPRLTAMSTLQLLLDHRAKSRLSSGGHQSRPHRRQSARVIAERGSDTPSTIRLPSSLRRP